MVLRVWDPLKLTTVPATGVPSVVKTWPLITPSAAVGKKNVRVQLVIDPPAPPLAVSSTMYRDQVPFGSIPVKADDNVVLPEGTGVGGVTGVANVSPPPTLLG